MHFVVHVGQKSSPKANLSEFVLNSRHPSPRCVWKGRVRAAADDTISAASAASAAAGSVFPKACFCFYLQYLRGWTPSKMHSNFFLAQVWPRGVSDRLPLAPGELWQSPQRLNIFQKTPDQPPSGRYVNKGM